MTTEIKSAIILAGGKGSRLSEQTKDLPKPLVEVGGIPVLFHIINHLISQGIESIFIAGGYKYEMILKAVHSFTGFIKCPADGKECKILVVDTGEETGTAQRIRMLANGINKPFFVTYGDSVSNVDLSKVEELLDTSGPVNIVLTAVQYTERFGVLQIGENNKVTEFHEKQIKADEYINGGFIACSANLCDLIMEDDYDFSKETMPRIRAQNGMRAYPHKGFWFAMDTQRDCEELNNIYVEHPEYFIKETY